MQKYRILFWLCLPTGLPAQTVAVMLDKMNALYAGVPNEITIAISDIPMERLVLTPSQGEIAAADKSRGKYEWKICERNSSHAWLILSDSIPENVIDTQFFRVIRLPEPRFQLAKGNGTIHSQSGIVPLLSGEACTKFWIAEILGFDATILPKRQDSVTFHNKGMRFNGEISNYLHRLNTGDAIWFSNITWKAGCDPTAYHSDEVLVFKIK